MVSLEWCPESALWLATGWLSAFALMAVKTIVRRLMKAVAIGSGFKHRITHLWRAVLGKDPHTWSRVDNLHGIKRAKIRSGQGAVFCGSGRMTSYWVCECGASTDTEPESLIEEEVA